MGLAWVASAATPTADQVMDKAHDRVAPVAALVADAGLRCAKVVVQAVVALVVVVGRAVEAAEASVVAAEAVAGNEVVVGRAVEAAVADPAVSEES